ncbi:hypothetical protein COU20_02770 [Candidatus Kaiserbacteria bacterium CG10_big_fil_rev_8_21_14_0_10_59_10]|uniref:Uncharacterized protein n=1 Tax=Candidatus Kaiserbacteria bacterium CG10_big_fil_rev_8_21_14_0_10_59_10 TaxID=1974612 RepID=A0A2H0U7D4_9BACT|nr:MAG: hypothetical protein COU20_02770 [Candidatus Kaiserbacteria bacterium CG10_big_fil_rev_8_21_14_0_10_59_10]
MTIRIISFAPLALACLMAASVAFAQGQNVTFPIAELGGCASKEQCKMYCDEPANIAACVSFAEANGLMSPAEAAQARTFAEITGPGGCRGRECRAVCADPARRTECMAFAQEHGLMKSPPPQDLHIEEPGIDEDRAMRIVEERGGPGGCRTKDECHAFCNIESNVEMCLAFAAEHNLMPPQDLERARKMMAEGGPGGCRGVACRTYCENPDHAEECFAFAEAQGLIKPEEVERARKLMNVTGPGGCRGIECKRICEDPARHSECFEFAVQNGFISGEDAARMRSFMEERGPGGFEFAGPPEGQEGVVGPGGCQGHEECARYCSERPDECGGFGPMPAESRDFGQDRAMDMRGFEAPPGLPCTTPEECRALYDERRGTFQGEMHEGNFEHMRMPPEGPFPPEGYPGEHSGEFNAEHEQYRMQHDEHYRQYHQQYEGGDGYQEPYLPENYEHDSSAPAADEPTSHLPASNFVATVFSIVARLLGI